jgi:hypothetical protein
MNALRIIRPWSFTTLAMLPILGIFGCCCGIYSKAWAGFVLSAVFLAIVLKIWRYQYDYYQDRIVLRRFFYANIIVYKEDMHCFIEMPKIPGTLIDYGPHLILKDKMRLSLPCDTDFDQKEFLVFLKNTYECEVRYLKK